MAFVRTDDGVRISYTSRGEGKTTVLFMHGWAGSGAYFDETLKYLDLTRTRALTFDMRGHGDSDKADTGYTDDRLGKDALAVADDAGAGEIAVVGFSMSGRFAQYLSVLAPKRILGQVLVAPCPASPIQLPEETRREWVSLTGDAERFKAIVAQFLSRAVDPQVIDKFGKEAAKAARAALDGTLRTLVQASFADKVTSLQTPTLIVGGIHDGLFPPDLLREWFKPAPCSRLAFLDSNHEIPIEQPRELAALLEAFLAGIEPNAVSRQAL